MTTLSKVKKLPIGHLYTFSLTFVFLSNFSIYQLTILIMLRINRLSTTIIKSIAAVTGLNRTIATINPLFINPTFRISQFGGIKQKMAFGTFKEEDHNQDTDLFPQVHPSDWKVDYSLAINMYPFHYIPTGLIRHPDNFTIEERVKQDLIAFKTLTLDGKDLDSAIQLLLSPQQIVALDSETRDTPKHKQLRVFQRFYKDRLPQMVQQVNNGKDSFQDRLKSMKILSMLSGVFVESIELPFLKEKKIIEQDPSGVLASYYIRYAINNRLEYVHILPLILQKMKNGSSQQKLNIARSILGAYNFMKNYPKKIIEEAVRVYQDQISTLHNYQLLYCMRFIYDYYSQASQNFAEAIMNHIITKHVEESNIDYHVPMILKSVKFITKQGLSCDKLIAFIKGNMQRFKIIFQKQNISTGFFFSLLYANIRTDMASAQTISYLKQYFFNQIDSIVKAEQIEEGQILRVSKLLLKYNKVLTQGDKQYIRQKYLSYILPHFGHQEDILLYSLLVVLRDRVPEPTSERELVKFQQKRQLIRKSIVQYVRLSSGFVDSKRAITRNINPIIQLYYQIQRHELNIPKEQLPPLLSYDFKQKDTVKPQVCGFFFTYLIHSTEKAADMRKVLGELQKTLQAYLRKRLLPLITVYSILDVCDIAGYEDRYLFIHLENNFAFRLISNPKLFVSDKDLRFIEKNLLNKGYGSQNLRKFIKKVLDNPKHWQKARFEYTEKQKAFQEKLRSKSNYRQSK